MTPRRALFLTAMDRPGYLRKALNSWLHVPELPDWHVVIRVEPSDAQATVLSMAHDFLREAQLPHAELVLNPERHGVLHHPWVGFDELFREHEYVVRMEDDLVVSDDVLRFFTWADEHYAADRRVGTVNAFTEHGGGSSGGTELDDKFNPWGWATWLDRWTSVIGPTWDHDYSTGSGNQRGWDWNLTLRVLPEHGWLTARPSQSRVKNIGEWGVHGTPENLPRSPSFVQFRGQVEFEMPVPEEERSA